MKKNYRKPLIKVKQVEPSQPVAESGTISTDNPPVRNWDANSRRGSWGNLWNDDDE